MREKKVTRVQTCPFLCQAEDGIRDYKVTGVQTCALPSCMVRGPEWRLPLSTDGHGCGGAQPAHRAGGGESSVQHRRRRSRHESLVASYRRSTRCFRPGEPVGRGSGKTSQRAWLLSPSCALWATGRKTDRVGPLSGKDAAAQTEACRAEQSGVSQEVGKPAVRRRLALCAIKWRDREPRDGPAKISLDISEVFL